MLDNRYYLSFTHFSVDVTELYFHHQQTDSDTGNYQSIRCQTHVTNINNNVDFKCLDIHCHSTSLSCCDTNDNVCLCLRNCGYSTFIVSNDQKEHLKINN